MHYVSLLPEAYARRFSALVLRHEDNNVIVGMVDPMDVNAFDAIAKILKYPITLVLISDMDLPYILDRVYRRTEEITHFAHELSEEMCDDFSESEDDLFDEAQDSEEQAPCS